MEDPNTVRHRVAVMLCAVLAAVLLAPAPARAAEPGTEVRLTRLPDSFRAGGDARTVTAEVRTGRDRERCRKVRWSLLLRGDGVQLDQIRIDRVEEGGSFPVEVRTEGGTGRVTDVRLDPGELCRNRTVSARWEVAFTGGASGRVAFGVQAFDEGGTVLAEASAFSEVAGRPSPSPSPSRSPSPSPSASPSSSEEPEETEEAAVVPPARSADLAGSSGPQDSNLLVPGLVFGGVLVFLGVSLLLRLRLRNKVKSRHRYDESAFYPSR